MNFFSICERGAGQHIETDLMYNNSYRQQTPKAQKSSGKRRIIESGDYIYDCPVGENEDCVSG